MRDQTNRQTDRQKEQTETNTTQSADITRPGPPENCPLNVKKIGKNDNFWKLKKN